MRIKVTEIRTEITIREKFVEFPDEYMVNIRKLMTENNSFISDFVFKDQEGDWNEPDKAVKYEYSSKEVPDLPIAPEPNK